MTLSADQMREVLDRFTYKRGVTLELNGFSVLSLVVSWISPSSRTQVGDVAHVRFEVPLLGTMSTEEVFRAWVKRVVIAAELHEIDEWLRFDGELVFDPHQDEAAVTSHARKVELVDLLDRR